LLFFFILFFLFSFLFFFIFFFKTSIKLPSYLSSPFIKQTPSHNNPTISPSLTKQTWHHRYFVGVSLVHNSTRAKMEWDWDRHSNRVSGKGRGRDRDKNMNKNKCR
jgi:hypothetical protein